MPRFILLRGTLHWPNRCAACSMPAVGTVPSSCSVVTDLRYLVFFVRTTHARTTVSYPACRYHRFLGRLASAISGRNLINLFLFVVWMFSLLALAIALYSWGALNELPQDPDVLSMTSAIVVGGAAALWFGRRFTPVRVTDANDFSVTLYIRDEGYAREFKTLNTELFHPVLSAGGKS